jgi:hypothetical protein
MQAVKLNPMNEDKWWFLTYWKYVWKHLFSEHKDLAIFEGAVPGFIIGLTEGLFLLQTNWVSLITVVVLVALYGASRLVEVDFLQSNPPHEHRGYFTGWKKFWMSVACLYLVIAPFIVWVVIQFILNIVNFFQLLANLPDLLGKVLSLVL